MHKQLHLGGVGCWASDTDIDKRLIVSFYWPVSLSGEVCVGWLNGEKKKRTTKKFFELSRLSFFPFLWRDPPNSGTSRATFSREFPSSLSFAASLLDYNCNRIQRNFIFPSQWLLFLVPFMALRSRLGRCWSRPTWNSLLLYASSLSPSGCQSL